MGDAFQNKLMVGSQSKRMEQNWNLWRGAGVQRNKPSIQGVWIFSGTTHSYNYLERSYNNPY